MSKTYKKAYKKGNNHTKKNGKNNRSNRNNSSRKMKRLNTVDQEFLELVNPAEGYEEEVAPVKLISDDEVINKAEPNESLEAESNAESENILPSYYNLESNQTVDSEDNDVEETVEITAEDLMDSQSDQTPESDEIIDEVTLEQESNNVHEPAGESNDILEMEPVEETTARSTNALNEINVNEIETMNHTEPHTNDPIDELIAEDGDAHEPCDQEAECPVMDEAQDTDEPNEITFDEMVGLVNTDDADGDTDRELTLEEMVDLYNSDDLICDTDDELSLEDMVDFYNSDEMFNNTIEESVEPQQSTEEVEEDTTLDNEDCTNSEEMPHTNAEEEVENINSTEKVDFELVPSKEELVGEIDAFHGTQSESMDSKADNTAEDNDSYDSDNNYGRPIIINVYVVMPDKEGNKESVISTIVEDEDNQSFSEELADLIENNDGSVTFSINNGEYQVNIKATLEDSKSEEDNANEISEATEQEGQEDDDEFDQLLDVILESINEVLEEEKNAQAQEQEQTNSDVEDEDESTISPESSEEDDNNDEDPEDKFDNSDDSEQQNSTDEDDDEGDLHFLVFGNGRIVDINANDMSESVFYPDGVPEDEEFDEQYEEVLDIIRQSIHETMEEKTNAQSQEEETATSEEDNAEEPSDSPKDAEEEVSADTNEPFPMMLDFNTQVHFLMLRDGHWKNCITVPCFSSQFDDDFAEEDFDDDYEEIEDEGPQLLDVIIERIHQVMEEDISKMHTSIVIKSYEKLLNEYLAITSLKEEDENESVSENTQSPEDSECKPVVVVLTPESVYAMYAEEFIKEENYGQIDRLLDQWLYSADGIRHEENQFQSMTDKSANADTCVSTSEKYNSDNRSLNYGQKLPSWVLKINIQKDEADSTSVEEDEATENTENEEVSGSTPETADPDSVREAEKEDVRPLQGESVDNEELMDECKNCLYYDLCYASEDLEDEDSYCKPVEASPEKPASNGDIEEDTDYTEPKANTAANASSTPAANADDTVETADVDSDPSTESASNDQSKDSRPVFFSMEHRVFGEIETLVSSNGNVFYNAVTALTAIGASREVIDNLPQSTDCPSVKIILTDEDGKEYVNTLRFWPVNRILKTALEDQYRPKTDMTRFTLKVMHPLVEEILGIRKNYSDLEALNRSFNHKMEQYLWGVYVHLPSLVFDTKGRVNDFYWSE